MLGVIIPLLVLGFFIWFISRKSSNNRVFEDDEFLRKSIREFEYVLRKSPDKSVKSLLEDYRKQLGREADVVDDSKDGKAISHNVSVKADVGIDWSHWYSRNSINLLLYVGAFLIVASASIFVGFQWDSLSGVIKASVLTAVAAAFFGFGMWFYNVPKIRDAGNTFIAIGAVLIPVCGLAWFNFVFKDMGVEPGIVWLGTSFIALSTYAFLAFNYKNKFYTYAAAIMSLSLSSSLVNTFALDSNYYILAGIVSGFVLLLLSYLAKKQDKEIQEFSLVPLEISSQIMMPLTLAAGFVIAITQDRLFTFEAVISVILAAGYYVLSYLYFRKAAYMVLSEVLFSLAIILFFSWQKLDEVLMLYVLNVVAFAYLYKASILKRYNLENEVDLTLVIGVAQSVMVLPMALMLGIDPLHTAILSLIPAFAGAVVAYIKSDTRFLGISSLSIAVAQPLFMQDVFKIPNMMEYLAYVYLATAVIFYATYIYFKKTGRDLVVFGFSVLLFFALSFVFGLSFETQRLVISAVIAGVGVHAALVLGMKEIIYLSNLFVMFALFNLLRLINIEEELYVFYYFAVAVILYAVSFMPLPSGKNLEEPYRNSALVTALITPLTGGLLGMGSISGSFAERNALISAYGATILYGVDVALRKKPNFGYVTSVIGMTTFLWQIKYLGVSESLAYTIPLGLYFMGLAYTRKLKSDEDGRKLFDGIGLFFLLAVPTFASFGTDAVKYSITLGILGIALVALGISLRYKLYKFAGVLGIVLCVLPQTYSYILDLPRWVIVGIGGLVFISVAIFLSLKRKE